MPPPPQIGTRATGRVVLLTGGSGYVGGRLLPLLERQPVAVRCLARTPEELRPHVREPTEVVPGDVLDPASLATALRGVDTAYYLVHLMADSAAFEADDRRAATNFAAAARAAGVRRIVYLGGLGDDADPGCRRTCGAATRSARSSARRAWKPSSSGPAWSSARAACRTSCSGR